MVNYMVAFSCAIVAGTCCYFVPMRNATWLDFGCFGLMTLQGVIGTIQNAVDFDGKMGEYLKKSWDFLCEAQDLFACSCVAGSIWFRHGQGDLKNIGYVHAVLPFLPLCMYLQKKDNKKLAQGVIAIAAISLGALCGLNENWIGVGCAVAFAVDYFVVKENGDFQDIPVMACYNIVLCGCAFLASRTMGW